jgi:hypothetical protein
MIYSANENWTCCFKIKTTEMRSILEKNLICLLENLQFLVTLICGLPRKPEVNIHMVLIQVVYQF